MIIFGTRTVVRPVRDGLTVLRVCGKCNQASHLVEHRSRQYLTLYFLPVFPVASAEKVLQCSRCKATYFVTPSDYAARGQASSASRSTVNCPYCGQLLRIPAESSQPLNVRCGKCRGEFSVQGSQHP